MRAFVTGGTGFVGTHLVAALERRGDAVTCLVRNPAKAAARGWRAVRSVRGDLHDAAALREACADAEIVYHVAGRISARDASAFMRANRDGTARVLEALGPGVRRLVLVSSIAAAGPSAPGRPLDEDRVPQPITDYGRSKLAGELLVRQAAVPWTIVRPVVVYGEWDRELLRIFRAARRGLGAVFGDGAQQLSVIYAGDLADALIAAGTTEAAAGGTYFATHDEPTTSRELVRAVARATGARRDPRIVAIPPALGRGALWAIGSLAHLIGRSTVLSADKANEFLAPAWTCRAAALARDTGWRARTDLAAGLARTAAWYRERRWL